MSEAPSYIPAAGAEALTPFYDACLALTMPERRIKTRLLELAEPEPGHRIADVGCGTGTLLLLARKLHPGATFVGIDPDPRILAIARRKAARRGTWVDVLQGRAELLPWPDGVFDSVVTSFAVHHLTTQQKLEAFREMRRVLRPGRSVLVADFGPGRTRLMRVMSKVFELADGKDVVADNLEGRVPGLMREAGLEDVGERAHFGTPYGSAWVWSGRKA